MGGKGRSREWAGREGRKKRMSEVGKNEVEKGGGGKGRC
jgi:hypothetical protein